MLKLCILLPPIRLERSAMFCGEAPMEEGMDARWAGELGSVGKQVATASSKGHHKNGSSRHGHSKKRVVQIHYDDIHSTYPITNNR